MTELYQILGQVTYSFSRIDFLLSSIAFDFGLEESPYHYFANSRFEDKLNKFNNQISEKFSDPEIIIEIGTWIKRLQNLREKRNTLVHSIVLSNADNKEDMMFYNYRLDKKDLVRDFQRYSLTELKDLNLEFVNAHNDGYTLFNKIRHNIKQINLNEIDVYDVLSQTLPIQNDFAETDYKEELQELLDFGVNTKVKLLDLVVKHREAVLKIDEKYIDDYHIKLYIKEYGEDYVKTRLKNKFWFAYSALLRIILELEFGEDYKKYANKRDNI